MFFKFCPRVWELIMYTHSTLHVSMTSTIVIFIKNKCNFLPSLPAIKSQSLKEAAPVVPQKSIFHPIPQNLALIYRTIQRREVGFWCGWFCLGLGLSTIISWYKLLIFYTCMYLVNLCSCFAYLAQKWKCLTSPCLPKVSSFANIG